MSKYFFLLLGFGFLLPISASAYPGCSTADIVIGGQAWAGCNTTKASISGSSWYSAPTERACAKGYRLPTRGDWETAIWYARLNKTTVASLLALPQNGGGYVKKVKRKITFLSRSSVLASYWSSTREDIWGDRPIILHLSSSSMGHRLDGTDGAYSEREHEWQRGELSFELVSAEVSEIANIRCIRP